ncbi:MAG: ATP-binding cassette domain-containing protein [Anaerorhabdus sp.]
MIKLSNVSKSFGDKKIFENYNLKISNNEITAIVGKSVTGKTTLLNIIGLLDNEYNGEVIVNGTS